MKVNSVKQNATSLRNLGSRVAFGSAVTAAEDATKFVGRRVKDLVRDKEQLSKLNPFQRLITNLGIDNNEMTNNLITAVGTAFVAPIFIAFNPFTKKESKETKTYSAARQPISAVITLGVQLALVNVANEFLDKWATNGTFKKFGIDFDAEPRESFLTKQIKKEGKKLNREELIKEIKVRQDLAEEKMVQKLIEEGYNPADTDLVGGKAYNAALKQIKKGKGVESEIVNSAITGTKKEMEGLTGEALREKRIRQAVKATIENSNSSYKFFRNIAGIGIGIAIVPITCSILNWAYPRIMEKLMPNVAAAKKAEKAKEVK